MREIILFEGELIKYPNICQPIYELGGVEIMGETAQIFENLKRKGLEHKNIQIVARVVEDE